MNRVDWSLTPERRAGLRAELKHLSQLRNTSFVWRYGQPTTDKGKARQKEMWSLDAVFLLRMRTIKMQLATAEVLEDERLRAHDRLDATRYALGISPPSPQPRSPSSGG